MLIDKHLKRRHRVNALLAEGNLFSKLFLELLAFLMDVFEVKEAKSGVILGTGYTEHTFAHIFVGM